MKHQQSLPLFTLHSSLFTLRVQKGAGTHMRLASRAGEPPPPQRPSPQNLATRRSHVTHSSLFTLHSSLFRFRESVGPCMAGPWSAGRLVGLLTDLRATSRSHSSLFTLHSSLFTLHRSPGMMMMIVSSSHTHCLQPSGSASCPRGFLSLSRPRSGTQSEGRCYHLLQGVHRSAQPLSSLVSRQATAAWPGHRCYAGRSAQRHGDETRRWPAECQWQSPAAASWLTLLRDAAVLNRIARRGRRGQRLHSVSSLTTAPWLSWTCQARKCQAACRHRYAVARTAMTF